MKKIIILSSLLSVLGLVAIDRTELEAQLAPIYAEKIVHSNRIAELKQKVQEMPQGKEALLRREHFMRCRGVQYVYGSDFTPCDEELKALKDAIESLEKTLEVQEVIWRSQEIKKLDLEGKKLIDEFQAQANDAQ